MVERSPKNPNWTMEELDAREVWAQEREYMRNADLTGEERLRLVERLRMMWHGPDAINTRIPRTAELVERTWD